ncbi:MULTISPECIES: transposase [unclassified Sphingomonas]|uniref:IS66 family transposase n=1 Tax=unclassified Sphingomonas TaxID=196159 RepID=UPI002269C8A1
MRARPTDERRHARRTRSRPLVDGLRKVLAAAVCRLSSRSDMVKAIAYGTKRWPALCRFLEDGRLEIDSNIAERALRGIAVVAAIGCSTAPAPVASVPPRSTPSSRPTQGVPRRAGGYIAVVIAKVANSWPASR